jgi:DNA polymerase-4
MSGRCIVHVDMDAFFVSVELLDRPELRGRPVVVGGTGERGVVAAASYEARAYGVHSAMPSVRARRLCPQAVFLAGRHDRYAEVSTTVMAVFRSFTPLVEPLSLDEAFLDVTGARRLHGDGPTIAAAIRRRVAEETGLTCSVGVAPVKFVAKLATEAAKPRPSPTGPRPGRGVAVVPVEGVQAFLRPLPVQALWGVGPATLARLGRLGVATVGELADLPVDVVVRTLGDAQGRHLHALANGVDERAVEPERRAKSVGHEETFARDRSDRAGLEAELVRYADAVAGRLRASAVTARTVVVKVRFGDFRTITRSVTLATPTATAHDLAAAGRTLLEAVDVGQGVRLLGLTAAGLATGTSQQLSFDDAGGDGRADVWPDAERAVDRIRERFGGGAIGPAAIVGDGGLRVKRRGEQQWGPDAG